MGAFLVCPLLVPLQGWAQGWNYLSPNIIRSDVNTDIVRIGELQPGSAPKRLELNGSFEFTNLYGGGYIQGRFNGNYTPTYPLVIKGSEADITKGGDVSISGGDNPNGTSGGGNVRIDGGYGINGAGNILLQTELLPQLMDHNVGIGIIDPGLKLSVLDKIGALQSGGFYESGKPSRYTILGDHRDFNTMNSPYKWTGTLTNWIDVATRIGVSNRFGGSNDGSRKDGLIEWSDQNAIDKYPKTYDFAKAGDLANMRFVFRSVHAPNANDPEEGRNEVMTLNSKGQVGIANPTPYGKLDVFQLDDPEISMGVFSYLANSAKKRNGDFVAVQGSNASMVGKNIAIGVQGIAIPVRDEEGNKEQINIGVKGSAYGTKRCYGVYGEAIYNGTNGQINGADPLGSWAGFFNGDIGGLNLYISSGKNLKSDIKALNTGLEILSKLKPKTYHFSNESKLKSLALDTKRLQYGLIAEEVEEVLPELVKENTQFALKDKDGKELAPSVDFKMVNYIGLIPILIDAINTLSNEVEILKKVHSSGSVARSENVSGLQSNPVSSNKLIISPNPNDGNVNITFSTTNSKLDYLLVLTDLQGKQLVSTSIEANQKLQLRNLAKGVINAFIFQAGKEVTTSRMLVQ